MGDLMGDLMSEYDHRSRTREAHVVRERGRKMRFHLPPERIHIQSAIIGTERLHVGPARFEQPRCAGVIPSFKVMDRYRGLNECLDKPALGRWALHPQILPDLVCVEVLAAIEELDSLLVARVLYF